MGNPFVHVELNTTDPARAKAFYGKLFDWKLEDVPMADGTTYTMVQPGEGTGGGLLKHPMRGRRRSGLPMWTSTICVRPPIKRNRSARKSKKT